MKVTCFFGQEYRGVLIEGFPNTEEYGVFKDYEEQFREDLGTNAYQFDASDIRGGGFYVLDLSIS
jgi:hypothetical protein